METQVVKSIGSIPVKSEFDILGVGKALTRILGSEVPGLKAWVATWEQHDILEIERRLERFWQAFVFEAKYRDDQFTRVSKDISDVNQQLDLLARVVQNVRAEFSEAKQDLYAKVAVNAILIPDSQIPHDQKLSAIEALDRLTTSDLDLLGKFSSGRAWQIQDLLPEAATDEDDALGTVIVSIRKLEARALINQTSGKEPISSSASIGTHDHWKNQWKYSYFEILPFGLKVLDLISAQ